MRKRCFKEIKHRFPDCLYKLICSSLLKKFQIIHISYFKNKIYQPLLSSPTAFMKHSFSFRKKTFSDIFDIVGDSEGICSVGNFMHCIVYRRREVPPSKSLPRNQAEERGKVEMAGVVRGSRSITSPNNYL